MTIDNAVIDVEQLTFTYPSSSRPAIETLDFSVGAGEIFGFLGPSGAGKSTTQKILIGLLRGYRGQVWVFGKSLSEWRSDYYERIGVAFELPNHYLKLTALENLSYFGALYSGKTRAPRELLEKVGLAENGGMLVSQLSKGMKTRLSVARALLNEPEILFLDEPTGGLDPVSARRIKDLVREQSGAGRTVFLTTHDMTVADELCDRVAFIVEGRIALIDRPRELRLKYGAPRVRVEFQGDSGIERREFPLSGLGDDAEFIDLLRSREVQTLHTLEATLEDVFIQVTGRVLS